MHLGECQEIKDSCLSILRKETCEFWGAAEFNEELESFLLIMGNKKYTCKEMRDVYESGWGEETYEVPGEDMSFIWVIIENIRYKCEEMQNSGSEKEEEGSKRVKSGGNISCIWINEETEGYKCQEIQKSCSSISREKTCEFLGGAKSNEGDLSCIWITTEDAEQNCQEIQKSCSSISKKTTCEFLGAAKSSEGDLSCIWVATEDTEQNCQEVRESCSLISREKTCEFSGAAKSKPDGRDSLCIWVGNRCVNAEVSCFSLTSYGSLTCEAPGAAGDMRCVWVDDECLEIQNSCEKNGKNKKWCEAQGVVVDETGSVISCVYSEDGGCHRKDEACDGYGIEDCLEHTELKCVVGEEGCRCASYICYLMICFSFF
jgi:hypothetical protein